MIEPTSRVQRARVLSCHGARIPANSISTIPDRTYTWVSVKIRLSRFNNRRCHSSGWSATIAATLRRDGE